MGLGNRQYYGGGGGGGIGLALPRFTPAVKWIMILCGGMFLLQLFLRGRLEPLLGASADGWWQVWRYITFQFLHSTHDFFHILFNMLGLYFLGTALEQRFGTKRFVLFYLGCGAVAGIAYVGMSFLLIQPANWWVPIIGASGGVYAIVVGAAILFPHFRIILLFFPVPIRLAAVLLFGVMGLRVLSGLTGGGLTPAFWSDVAHLGGGLAAAIYFWVIPQIAAAGEQAKANAQQGAWERRMRKREAEEAAIDAILDKVQRNGIQSLTDKERRALQDATERRRREGR